MKRYRNDRGQGIPLMRWVQHHPIASIFGLWVTLMLLAGLSTATLVSIDSEAKMTAPPDGQDLSKASAEPTPVFLTQHSSLPERESVPLISFGAIAVSCTLGCLVLSQLVRPAPRPQRLYKSRSTALPRSSGATEAPNRAETADSNAVMVVPSEQDHPLDWDEPSLADSLDLRQRRPLSHWL
jgi:hypothetical protein